MQRLGREVNLLSIHSKRTLLLDNALTQRKTLPSVVYQDVCVDLINEVFDYSANNPPLRLFIDLHLLFTVVNSQFKASLLK